MRLILAFLLGILVAHLWNNPGAVVEWKEYIDIKAEEFLEKMNQPIIIDGRRVHNYKKFREKGIKYRGIGLGR